MQPLPLPFLNTHRNFPAVFDGILRSFSACSHIPSCLVLILCFFFISRIFLYEKRGGGEEVSRSHFSFPLDKLSWQRCSGEISDRKKITLSGLLFFSYFSFPTAWQKAYLCFIISQNCVFHPCLGRVWRLRGQWGHQDGLVWPGAVPCPTRGPCLGCCMRPWGWGGEQPVAQVAATPSHHLELHSYRVALKNEKEMGRSYSSLAKNRNVSGQAR